MDYDEIYRHNEEEMRKLAVFQKALRESGLLMFPEAATVPGKKRGRPPGKSKVLWQQTPEGRRRISEAMKRRRANEERAKKKHVLTTAGRKRLSDNLKQRHAEAKRKGVPLNTPKKARK